VDLSALRDLNDAAAALPCFSGNFALHLQDGNRHLFVRDPLGVNKLFVAANTNEMVSSNYLFDLLCQGYGIEQITSVPSGYALWVDTCRKVVQGKRYSSLFLNNVGHGSENGASARSDAACVGQIRRALKNTFQEIQRIAADRQTYVTMSGGLDSTIIALMARDYIPNLRGVTLSVVAHGGSSESEDVSYARRVARDLGIPLTVLTATPENILNLVDEVLMWGQDWREFNVHCGLVNSALGHGLAATLPVGDSSPRPLLLTGDAMNEMMADYAPVRYGNRDLYTLPQLGRSHLRRCLVAGLDSGDREVGILARMGFSTIQPYTIAAPAYLALPAKYLAHPDARQQLARRVFGSRIPEYVLNRAKVRAQAGSSAEPRGTMAVLLDAGIDQAFLQKRWCELFGVRPESLNGIIRAGIYKYSIRIY
jgi:asparagine synthase (glutamine-hydrolysing)